MATVNLKLELRREQLHQLDLVKDAYWFEVRTPAHLITNVIADLSDGQKYIGSVARDSFDEALGSTIVQFMRKHQSQLQEAIPSQILFGFHHETAGFDCVLAINRNAHSLFANQSPILHEHVVEAVPIYRCEFSGDETPEILQLVRRKCVDTLDWHREPSPRVWLSFFDADTGTRSTGHKLGLTSKNIALDKIQKLSKSAQSWAEIQNYAGQRVRISFNGRNYVIESKTLGLFTTVDISSFDEWVERFLLFGIQASSKYPMPHRAPLNSEEPQLSVFLFDQERDRRIDSSKPFVVGLTQAFEEFDRLSDTEGSFIGFQRSDGKVLQFVWNSDGTLEADIPLPTENGSLQRHGTWEELRPLIAKFSIGVPVNELPEVRFQPYPQQAKTS